MNNPVEEDIAIVDDNAIDVERAETAEDLADTDDVDSLDGEDEGHVNNDESDDAMDISNDFITEISCLRSCSMFTRIARSCLRNPSMFTTVDRLLETSRMLQSVTSTLTPSKLMTGGCLSLDASVAIYYALTGTFGRELAIFTLTVNMVLLFGASIMSGGAEWVTVSSATTRSTTTQNPNTIEVRDSEQSTTPADRNAGSAITQSDTGPLPITPRSI